MVIKESFSLRLPLSKIVWISIFYNFQIHDADTSEDQSSSSKFKTEPGWKQLERCAALCNRAEFKPGKFVNAIVKVPNSTVTKFDNFQFDFTRKQSGPRISVTYTVGTWMPNLSGIQVMNIRSSNGPLARIWMSKLVFIGQDKYFWISGLPL